MARLDHIDILLPKIWVRVRSALENDSRNYITREQYYTDQSRKIEISGGNVDASGSGAFSLGNTTGTVANTSISGETMHGGIQTYKGDNNTLNQGNPLTNHRTIHIGDGNYNEGIEGNYIQGDYHAAVANEILSILQQLEKSNSTHTTAGKMAIATHAIEHIENHPILAARVLSAFKAGGTQALTQFLHHPAASFVLAALDDWNNSHQHK